jgi:hypothetical protein
MNVRALRAVGERVSFKTARGRLKAFEVAAVKAVIGELRKAEELPGDADYDDLIPPCIPVWRRSVPGTDLWVVYEVGESGSIFLWALKSDSRKV